MFKHFEGYYANMQALPATNTVCQNLAPTPISSIKSGDLHISGNALHTRKCLCSLLLSAAFLHHSDRISPPPFRASVTILHRTESDVRPARRCRVPRFGQTGEVMTISPRPPCMVITPTMTRWARCTDHGVVGKRWPGPPVWPPQAVPTSVSIWTA